MRMVKSALFLAAIALLALPLSAQDPGREFRAHLTGPTENISILSGATVGEKPFDSCACA